MARQYEFEGWKTQFICIVGIHGIIAKILEIHGINDKNNCMPIMTNSVEFGHANQQKDKGCSNIAVQQKMQYPGMH